MPPDSLTKATERNSFDELVVHFRDKKADRLLQVLKAAKNVEPVIDSSEKTAVFHLQEEVGGLKEIALKQFGLRWYIDGTPPPSLAVGSAAPSFDVETITGRKIHSNQLRGKMVVLHFWATWCGPCVRHMPDHIKSLEQHPSSDVETIFICMDDDTDEIISTINNYNIPFSNVAGRNGWADYRVSSLPTDIVIDRNGKIVSNSIDDIEKLLNRTDDEPNAG